jgi:hypothetical protein
MRLPIGTEVILEPGLWPIGGRVIGHDKGENIIAPHPCVIGEDSYRTLHLVESLLDQDDHGWKLSD